MKIIELLIDEELELAGITAVSLVRFPAIEENFVFFNRGERYVLAKIDEAKRMLIGPALIPDKKIPRYNEETDEEYEVYFSADTVKQASQLYMREERTNSNTYEHVTDVDGLTVVESWIIEDRVRDKSTLYGFDLPIGTWMLSMKIHNEDMWQAILKKDVRGFSIEGYFIDEIIKAKRLEKRIPCPNCPDDIETLETLKTLVLEEMKAVLHLDGRPLWSSQEEAELYGELFNNCIGSHEHNIDGIILFMSCEQHVPISDSSGGPSQSTAPSSSGGGPRSSSPSRSGGPSKSGGKSV